MPAGECGERKQGRGSEKTKTKQVAGLAVYALPTVIAGNGRESIDLAKANARELW